MAVGISSFLSLLVGAVLVTTVMSDAVSFSKYDLKVSAGTIHQSPGKSEVNFILAATTSESSAGASGTGLWKMSIFGSKVSDPGDTTDALDEQAQVLDQANQDKEVAAGETYQFSATAKFKIGDMGGCAGDYQYLCVVFSEGDNPRPQFELANGYSACLSFGFKCAKDEEPTPDDQKHVVLSTSSWSLGWGIPQSGDETFGFTVKLAESSRQNLAGTGLWKLMVSWSKENNPGSADHFDEQSLLTDPADSGKSLVNGGDLEFQLSSITYSEQAGCGEGKYNFLCVAFGKGDNADPDFDLSQGFNYCSDTCQ